jgi:predicted phosphodiesterase
MRIGIMSDTHDNMPQIKKAVRLFNERGVVHVIHAGDFTSPFNQPHIFELDGKRIVVIHEHQIAEALADSGHYDLVIYGHTHKAEVRKAGAALVVNPGEAGSWLYGKSTVAVANLADMTAEIVAL